MKIQLLTASQWKSILKWSLYGVLFLFSMLLQSSVLPRMPIGKIFLSAVPVCVACVALEEGTEAELADDGLGVVVGEPAQFKLFGSTVRRSDKAGDVLEDMDVEALDELPPMETTLTAVGGHGVGQVVPVRLKARVTEVGTLELSCAAAQGEGEWKLEFDLRGNDGVGIDIDLSDLEVT